jgi:hypothetical protein
MGVRDPIPYFYSVFYFRLFSNFVGTGLDRKKMDKMKGIKFFN